MIRDNLKLQIEITPTCNAMCRGCDRFMPGTDIVNPMLPTGKSAHMDFDFFKKIFSEQEIKDKMHVVFFTGAYGDCIMHPRVKEFIRHVLPFSWVRIETNGGLHSEEWWEDLGDNRIKVEFALDGTDNDTHSTYRRNVVYDKVLANARAFIKGGGIAIWTMIEHSHNSHQIQDAKKLAEEYGFNEFKLKRSRISNYSNLDKSAAKTYDRGVITDVKHKRIPVKDISIEFSEREQNKLQSIEQSIGFESQKDYENFTDITCGWGNNNKFNIDHNGILTQCCRFSSLYLQSPPKDYVDINHGVNKERSGGYQYYLDKYEDNWNSLHHNALTDILNHQFFTNDLLESFDNPGGVSRNPRITNKCPKYCGEIQTQYNKGDNENI